MNSPLGREYDQAISDMIHDFYGLPRNSHYLTSKNGMWVIGEKKGPRPIEAPEIIDIEFQEVKTKELN